MFEVYSYLYDGADYLGRAVRSAVISLGRGETESLPWSQECASARRTCVQACHAWGADEAGLVRPQEGHTLAAPAADDAHGVAGAERERHGKSGVSRGHTRSGHELAQRLMEGSRMKMRLLNAMAVLAMITVAAPAWAQSVVPHAATPSAKHAASAPAPAVKPHGLVVNLSPNHGPAGTSVTVLCEGFPVGDPVEVFWGTAVTGTEYLADGQCPGYRTWHAHDPGRQPPWLVPGHGTGSRGARNAADGVLLGDRSDLAKRDERQHRRHRGGHGLRLPAQRDRGNRHSQGHDTVRADLGQRGIEWRISAMPAFGCRPPWAGTSRSRLVSGLWKAKA